MLLTFAVTILVFKVNEIFANFVVNSDVKKLFHHVVVNALNLIMKARLSAKLFM